MHQAIDGRALPVDYEYHYERTAAGHGGPGVRALEGASLEHRAWLFRRIDDTRHSAGWLVDALAMEELADRTFAVYGPYERSS